jgi:hypothetical protein
MAEADLGIAVRVRSALCPPRLPWAVPVCSMAGADLGTAVRARSALRPPRLPWAEPVSVCSMAGIPVKVAIAPNSWDHYVSLSSPP